MSRIVAFTMITVDQFLRLIEAYQVAAGLAEATVSTRLFNDGKRLAALRAESDVGIRRLMRAWQWLSDNWPAGAEWPAGVPRPSGPAAAGDAAAPAHAPLGGAAAPSVAEVS